MHPYSNFAVFVSSEMYLKRLPKEPIQTHRHTHIYTQIYTFKVLKFLR